MRQPRISQGLTTSQSGGMLKKQMPGRFYFLSGCYVVIEVVVLLFVKDWVTGRSEEQWAEADE